MAFLGPSLFFLQKSSFFYTRKRAPLAQKFEFVMQLNFTKFLQSELGQRLPQTKQNQKVSGSNWIRAKPSHAELGCITIEYCNCYKPSFPVHAEKIKVLNIFQVWVLES